MRVMTKWFCLLSTLFRLFFKSTGSRFSDILSNFGTQSSFTGRSHHARHFHGSHVPTILLVCCVLRGRSRTHQESETWSCQYESWALLLLALLLLFATTESHKVSRGWCIILNFLLSEPKRATNWKPTLFLHLPWSSFKALHQFEEWAT